MPAYFCICALYIVLDLIQIWICYTTSKTKFLCLESETNHQNLTYFSFFTYKSKTQMYSKVLNGIWKKLSERY